MGSWRLHFEDRDCTAGEESLLNEAIRSKHWLISSAVTALDLTGAAVYQFCEHDRNVKERGGNEHRPSSVLKGLNAAAIRAKYLHLSCPP